MSVSSISGRIQKDIHAEQCFAELLQKSLYPRLKVDSFCRVKDAALQRKGADVLMRTGVRTWVVDEKLAAHYLNSDKTNFVLELALGNGKPGWFLNDSLYTDIYAFIWGRLDEARFPLTRNEKRTNYYRRMEYEDITKACVQFYQKPKMAAMLNQYGITAEKLLETAKAVSLAETRTGVFTYRLEKLGLPSVPGVVGMSLNTVFSERPVVLIVDKYFLRKAAFGMYYVYKDGYKQLPCGPAWEPKTISQRAA